MEVWDLAVTGHAFHVPAGVKIHPFPPLKPLKYKPYFVVHTDNLPPPGKVEGMVIENIPGEQPDEVWELLNGNDFLLDIGHAFSSNLYLSDEVNPFDFARWFALKPKALHFHDCRIDIPNPWGKPDAADHQLLGSGILPLKEILKIAEESEVEYVALECFYEGYGAKDYSFAEKREALDRILA